MSDVTKAPLQVAPQVHDTIRALLRTGRNDEAIARACAVSVIRPDDLIAKELLFDAFFPKRDWLPAHALAAELAHRQPDVPRLQKAMIATLSNMKRYDETIAQAYHYNVRHGEDLTMLDALKVAYFYTGKIDEKALFHHRPNAKYGHDQRMLGRMLWPLIRGRAWFTTNITISPAYMS
jgi:hypothetical protein